MNADHLTSLRQAATALISTAAAPVVLAALRTLLSDPEFAWGANDLPTPTVSAAASADDPEWEPLRQRVREAKAVRHITTQGLADELGLAYSTLDNALHARRPPTKALQQRLEDWVNTPAPEVAALRTTFRPSAASRVYAEADLSAAD